MSESVDKLNDDANYDTAGKALPVVEGDPGSSAPPATSAETVTAPAQPSPIPVTDPAATTAPAEKKPGEAAPDKTPVTETTQKADDKLTPEEEAEIKEKYSRPEDKTGKEHEIRLYREAQKLRKRFEPIQEVFEKIGSPDRARRGLELTAELADPEVPIANAWDKMTALTESRAIELQTYIYDDALDNHPDTVATDLVGEKTTKAELQEGLKLLRSGAKASASAPPQPAATTTTVLQKPEGMTDDDWDDLQNDPGLKPAYDLLKAQQARLAEAAKPAEAVEAKEPELSPAEKRLKEIEEQQQKTWVDGRVNAIVAEGEKIYENVYSVVTEGLRSLGLEPDPAKHDEKQVKLIERTAKRIQDATDLEFSGPPGPNKTADDPEGWEDDSLCTDEQRLNRKLMRQVKTALANHDFAAAHDFDDRLKAQADLAFQRAVDPEIEIYNAAMLQSTSPKPRDATEHRRPELVGGTAPGGVTPNKTPWLEEGYRQPGETNIEAMNRYFASQAA